MPRKRLVIVFLLVALLSRCAQGQATGAPKPVPIPASLPVTAQMKKAVAFIKTRCVHDYTTEMQAISSQLPQMMTPQALQVLQSLVSLTNTLKDVRVISAKLPQKDVDRLGQAFHTDAADRNAINAEIAWRSKMLLQMTALSEAETSVMTPEEAQRIPVDTISGTGFFVTVPVDLNASHAGGLVDGFPYLVTNHHVAQPGAEQDKPLVRVDTSLMLNHKPDASHPTKYAEAIRISFPKWEYPSDPSVDLAVTQVSPLPD